MADVHVDTLVDRDAAVARVTVVVGNRTASYTASSKRHPRDSVNMITGEALAVQRALAMAHSDLEEFTTRRIDESANYDKIFRAPVNGFGEIDF